MSETAESENKRTFIFQKNKKLLTDPLNDDNTDYYSRYWESVLLWQLRSSKKHL